MLTFSEILCRDGGGGGQGWPGRKPYHFCVWVDYNFFKANVVHKSEGQAGHFGARSFGHFGLYPSSLVRSAGFFSLAEKASLVFISGTFLFLWERVFIYRWSSNFLRKVALKRERWWLRCHLVPPPLCSSRKYPYPSPDEGQQIFRGEGGPKNAISEGLEGGFLRFFN